MGNNPTRTGVIAGALLLVPVAVVLCQLQADLTNRAIWLEPVFHGYLNSLGNALFWVRGLARWVIHGVARLAPAGTSLETINLWLQMASVWGAMVATMIAARRYDSDSGGLAAALLLAAYIGFGFLRSGYRIHYPYDMPAVLFSALGLLCIIADRPLWLGLVLAAGTSNKETTLWLVPAYAGAAWARGVRLRSVIAATLGLAAVFAAAYAVPRFLYRFDLLGFRRTFPSHGFNAEAQVWVPRWRDNLTELLTLRNSGPWQNLYWAFSIHLLPLVFLRRLPVELRGAYLGVPVFAGALLVLGNIWELRIWNEILPLGAVACVCVIVGLGGGKDATATPASEGAGKSVTW